MKDSKFTWSYLASFLRITSSILIYPIILDHLSVEEVGIWGIFQVFIFLGLIVDFGFNSSFSRNFSYAYAGSTTVQSQGVSITKQAHENGVLLKRLIHSTQRFYSALSILFLILMIPLGSCYILTLVDNNTGINSSLILASWLILAISIAYGLYTHRYEAILVGKNMITIVKKAQVLGSISYLLLAFFSAFSDYTILALCIAHLVSNIVIRYVYYYGGYKIELNRLGYNKYTQPPHGILDKIAPNAIKTGITSIGGFLVTKSGVLMAGLYLPLKDVAVFTLSQQAVGVLAGLSSVYIKTILPSLNAYRINENLTAIRAEFYKSTIIILIVFVCGGIGLVYIGDDLLDLLTQDIDFLKKEYLTFLIVISLLESNHSAAGLFLTTKNVIPFFLPSIFSGIATLLLLFVFLDLFQMGLISLILAPGIVQFLYQNWKWPLEVYKDLHFNI